MKRNLGIIDTYSAAQPEERIRLILDMKSCWESVMNGYRHYLMLELDALRKSESMRQVSDVRVQTSNQRDPTMQRALMEMELETFLDSEWPLHEFFSDADDIEFMHERITLYRTMSKEFGIVIAHLESKNEQMAILMDFIESGKSIQNIAEERELSRKVVRNIIRNTKNQIVHLNLPYFDGATDENVHRGKASSMETL